MDERIEIALKGSEFKRVLENHFERIKRKYNLKKVDIEVLYYLSEYEEDNTPTDIHRRLKINRGHVSQAIDSLIKKEYIIALPDSDDRRCMHYTVSEDAKGIIEEIKTLKRDFDMEIFNGITEEEVDFYKKITYKIMKNLDHMIGG